MNLSQLRPGESAVVTELCHETAVAARLMEMGLVPGEVVQVIRRAPFGDPVEYRIRGVRISMRAADAACVSVTTAADRASA